MDYELCWCGKRGFSTREDAARAAANTRSHVSARNRGRPRDRRPMEAYECSWKRNGDGATSGLWHAGHPGKAARR